MLNRLDRYLLKEIYPPFFIGLLISSFFLLMNQFFLFSELIVSRGVKFGVATELLLDLIPATLAFTIPMAVAMGALAAMSRLSSDWEIMAFKTLGVSLERLARPVFIFAFLAWALTSAFTLYLAPHFNNRWVRMLTESVLSRIQFQIAPREFNESIPRTMLFIQESDVQNIWSKVMVYQVTDGQVKLILAARGKLNVFPEVKKAVLELFSGEIHLIPLNEPERHTLASFERHEEVVDVASLFPEFSRQKRGREKNILELFRDVKKLRTEIQALGHEATSSRPNMDSAANLPAAAFSFNRKRKMAELRSHEVELHKRFSLPAVCFLFAFLGLPLGVSTRRGGRASGFTLSLLVILVYYVLITGGEKAALEGRVAPSIGMWGPNLIFLAVAVALFRREAREEKISWPRSLSRLASWKQIGRVARRLGRSSGKAGASLSSSRRLFFPALLDRYLTRRFIFIFSLVVCALLSIAVIVTIFERLDNIYEHNKPFSLLLQYIGYRLPEFILFIIPVATLTTTLLTLGLLAKTNELTAVKASGISLYRLVVPVIILAFVFSGVSFYFQEYIVPQANKKAEETWNRINDVPPQTYSLLDRRWVMARDGQSVYHFSYFDPIAQVFYQLTWLKLNLESWQLKEISVAEKARLLDHQLSLVNGWRREFLGERSSQFMKFKEMDRTTKEKADYFLQEWREPSWMNYQELRNYIQDLTAMGLKTERLRVELLSKLSFPLVSLVMALLAIPFAFTMGRRGTLFGVGLSIIIALVYWGLIGFLKNLGYIGVLPVGFAAWGPLLLFASLSLYLTSRLRT